MSDPITRIKAGYDLDQQRKDEKVLTAEQLPLAYESITDEWLTDVLCRGHRGARVVRHTLDKADNGTSNRRKIYVEYNDVGARAGLPTALFCKASHDLVNRLVLGTSGAAHTETTFYNTIRPLLKIEAPECFFAAYDPNTFNSIIVLRDLTGKGTQFCTHATQITRKRVESQLDLLGELHGSCYRSPEIKERLAGLSTWPEYFERTLAFGLKEGSNQGFLSAKEMIPPNLFRRFDEIWPATVQSVMRHTTLPMTLAHGDVHLKNWYVAGNGSMGLSDWQCCARGHWSRDFAYTISTALTVEDRRAWEKDLLRYYLQRLQSAGGPVVPFDEAWNHYRQQLLSSLAWWTVTLTPPPGLPDMQPRDITLEFIRRISIAMDDVDSLGSFR